MSKMTTADYDHKITTKAGIPWDLSSAKRLKMVKLKKCYGKPRHVGCPVPV